MSSASNSPDSPLASAARLRARFRSALRGFFDSRGFLEVSTPVWLRANAPEEYIDAIPALHGWLRTSPELAMKRLLAAGLHAIYQLGPCFRRDESGRIHRPEFAMLEWYRAPASSADILDDARALLEHLARSLNGSSSIQRDGTDISLSAADWELIPVSDAFLRHAGWDPAENFDPDRFDLDLVSLVEPALPKSHPVVLCHYPAPLASLARRLPDDPLRADRWELYIAGVEIANAYGELNDPAEQRARFREANAVRTARGAPPYPLDEDFLADLARMPPAGGIALGVDRLLMLLSGADSLDAVLPFPPP